jgi:phage terminase large subunit GpA-like protein
MLIVEPTVDLAKKVSKQRIATMIATTPALTGKVAEARSRDSSNTMFEKEFPGGMLLMAGANSATGLRSMPIKFLFLDEIDGYPMDVDDEGDPIGLAEERTATFARRKIFKTSTPTIKHLSRIEGEYLRSDQRHYFVPCIECGDFDFIRWERLQWTGADLDDVRLLCKACGALIEERHKNELLERGRWQATAAGDGRTAGFHISTLYAPIGWRSWASCAREFRIADEAQKNGDVTKLKKFVNTVLGETFEERGQSFDAADLVKRIETYAAEVPAGVGVLTASVDVQGDRLELAVVGWGAGEESWLIAAHQVHGSPVLASTWFELDELLLGTYTHESGRKLIARTVAIDSGGLHTEHVYRFVKPRESRRVAGEIQHVYAIKGVGGPGHEIVGRPSTGNRYQVKLFPVGVDGAKDVIFQRMQRTAPGPGYMHLPAWIDEEYLAQLTAEKAIRKYKKGVGAVREYVKIRERNEGLDLQVYAFAALHMLGRRTIAELGALAAENSLPVQATTPALEGATDVKAQQKCELVRRLERMDLSLVGAAVKLPQTRAHVAVYGAATCQATSRRSRPVSRLSSRPGRRSRSIARLAATATRIGHIRSSSAAPTSSSRPRRPIPATRACSTWSSPPPIQRNSTRRAGSPSLTHSLNG